MQNENDAPARYVVPRYEADGDPAWYHVLHGTVPGHQIDFIYQPAVPQGRLTQTHFAHVARLMKYIEPREMAAFAFAIGNLSRDDVQHEPGHGGVAILFSLRVEGVIDHASRAMPPYAHGLLAIDRALDDGTLVDAVTTFYRRFLHEGPSRATGSFYRAYVQMMRKDPQAVEAFLAKYIADFDELPQPKRSKLGADFLAPEGAARDRITIVHPDNEPFSTIASVASALGSVLYRSNVKWTTISNGGDFDIPGGISIRFVPESEAPRDPKGLLLTLDDVPGDEAEIADKLFGAKPRETTGAPVRAGGWRAQFAKKTGASLAELDAPPRGLPSTRPAAIDTPAGTPAPARRQRTLPPGGDGPAALDTPSGTPAPARRQRTLPPGGSLPDAVAALTESPSKLPRAGAGAGDASGAVTVSKETPPSSGKGAPAASAVVAAAAAPTAAEVEAKKPAVAAKDPPSQAPGIAKAAAATKAAPNATVPVPGSGTAAIPPAHPTVASGEGEDVNLDGLAPSRPGKARWVIVGGVLAASAVGLVMAMSGPSEVGSGAPITETSPTPPPGKPSSTVGPQQPATGSTTGKPGDTSDPGSKPGNPPGTPPTPPSTVEINRPPPTTPKTAVRPVPARPPLKGPKPKIDPLDDPNLN